MTDSQKKWLLNWANANLTTSEEVDRAAKIAWQYDLPEDVIQEIKNIKKRL